MATTWNTHHIDPLPIGGAARLTAFLSESVEAVRAILAPVAATDAEVVPEGGVSINLALGLGKWRQTAWGAQGALACSWFAKIGGSWVAGPVDTIALPFNLFVRFPLPIDWIVDRLQEYAAAVPPFESKPFSVSRTYPRNTGGWPMASVQVDDVSLDAAMIGNRTEILPNQNGSLYQVAFSIVAWCLTPEDRKVVTPWMAGAMEALKLCAKSHPDLYDPSISLAESEDFSSVEGTPAFLTSGRLTAKVQSFVTVTNYATYGRVTVP